MTSEYETTVTGRAAMTLTGASAGLTIWLLIELLPTYVDNSHLLLLVAALVAGFFAALLAMAGPLSIGRAALGAGGLAAIAALFLEWASFRFVDIEPFLGSGFALSAWGAILWIGTPFVALRLWNRNYWVSYLDLFEFSWSVVVRYAAAWLFVGLFWAVLFLSDALLSLVSVNWIEDLIDIDPVPFLLTGAVLGLALRVVWEMRDYLSPYLVLHLLRLLLPVLLMVMVVFVLALPMSDPKTLFGGLSPAGTMMGAALGGICLISVALDKSDADAVSAVWMQWATRLLALLLPVLCGVALYGIWLRVAQYGWTPARLAALVAALVVLAYALIYALAVLRGGDWMARIRRGNLVMAGIVLALSLLWLSPLLNAEAISARSQVARYLGGATTVEQTAIWELSHDWGRPGKRQLARLQALEGDEHAALRAAIAAAGEAESRYSFEDRVVSDPGAPGAVALAGLIRSLPGEGTLAPALLRDLPPFRIEDWLTACERDRAPGCMLVQGAFAPQDAMLTGILLLPGTGADYEAMSVHIVGGRLIVGEYLRDMITGRGLRLTAEDAARVLAGDYRIAPSSRRSLWLGDLELYPEN
ncbi:hypothetical protein [Shimia sp.]|uniref:hypothetical protein n=1 Tax=Shimia sp. TaxID=1954381 RepID=UPI003563DCE4